MRKQVEILKYHTEFSVYLPTCLSGIQLFPSSVSCEWLLLYCNIPSSITSNGRQRNNVLFTLEPKGQLYPSPLQHSVNILSNMCTNNDLCISGFNHIHTSHSTKTANRFSISKFCQYECHGQINTAATTKGDVTASRIPQLGCFLSQTNGIYQAVSLMG